MELFTGNQFQGGGYQPPHKKPEQNVLLWVCIGILAVVLMGGMLFVGLFLFNHYWKEVKEVQPTPTVQTTPAVTTTPAATPTTAPTVVPTAAPTVGGGSYYYPDAGIYFVNAFTHSDIFVRTEPTKQSTKLMLIAKGDTNVRLRYLGETVSYDPVDNRNYVWYMVETPNGTVGYVRSDVVRQW